MKLVGDNLDFKFFILILLIQSYVLQSHFCIKQFNNKWSKRKDRLRISIIKKKKKVKTSAMEKATIIVKANDTDTFGPTVNKMQKQYDTV